jgi:O-antigen ligase
MYMSLQSGERGSWIAIPPLLFLWVISHIQGKLWIKLVSTMLVIVFMMWLSYSISEVVHDRVNSAFNELASHDLANKNSSIGIRMQLWLAALHLFIEQPFFGVGPNQFAHSLATLQTNGMLTAEAVKMGHSEVHSEILAKCVETGLFGLLSFLSIYLIPIFIFWHACHSTTSTIRTAGFMGICFISGFFIFGLTVEIFNLIMTASFFSLTLAVLMAVATNKSAS